MADPNTAFDLGNHDARLGHLEESLQEMRADVRAIRETLAAAKGGWRTLMLVAGAGGAAGGGLAQLAQWFDQIR